MKCTNFLLIVFTFFGFCSCNSSKSIESDLKTFELIGKVSKVIIFDENQKITSEVYFTESGMLLNEKYDGKNSQYIYEDNKLIMLSMFSRNNTIETKRKYTYSDDGLLTEIREFDSHNTYQKKVCYKYDKNGNMLRGDLLSAYNDTLYSWQYSYSATNKMLTERDVSPSDGGYERNYKYIYDSLDNIVEIQEFEGEKELMKKRIFAQFHNFPLQTKTYSYWAGEIDDSTVFNYQFDKNGNWIYKEAVPLRGKKIITKRLISYY